MNSKRDSAEFLTNKNLLPTNLLNKKIWWVGCLFFLLALTAISNPAGYSSCRAFLTFTKQRMSIKIQFFKNLFVVNFQYKEDCKFVSMNNLINFHFSSRIIYLSFFEISQPRPFSPTPPPSCPPHSQINPTNKYPYIIYFTPSLSCCDYV